MNHYESWCLNHPLDSHNFRRLHHTPKRPSRLLGPTDVSLPIHPQFRRKLSEITPLNRFLVGVAGALRPYMWTLSNVWTGGGGGGGLTSRRVSAMKREACSSAKACPCFTADLRENWNDGSGGLQKHPWGHSTCTWKVPSTSFYGSDADSLEALSRQACQENAKSLRTWSSMTSWACFNRSGVCVLSSKLSALTDGRSQTSISCQLQQNRSNGGTKPTHWNPKNPTLYKISPWKRYPRSHLWKKRRGKKKTAQRALSNRGPRCPSLQKFVGQGDWTPS